MMDSITIQKRNVGRKIRRTIRRLENRLDSIREDIYFADPRKDTAAHWKSVDALRVSIKSQRSALKRIDRL